MYSADWFGKNGKNWWEWLKHLAGKPNLLFLEIGCFEGMATVWLLKYILTDKSSTIETIDTFEGTDEYTEKETKAFANMEKNYFENIKPYEEKVKTHKGFSSDELISLNWIEKEQFDFIYIDGSHKSIDVLTDSILAWRLLKKGGIIIWDDYKWNRNKDPKLNSALAIDSFLTIFEGKFELINKGYQVCIKKIA